eukprot:5529137-Pyramimonas_sp.AAC.1
MGALVFVASGAPPTIRQWLAVAPFLGLPPTGHARRHDTTGKHSPGTLPLRQRVDMHGPGPRDAQPLLGIGFSKGLSFVR